MDGKMTKIKNESVPLWRWQPRMSIISASMRFVRLILSNKWDSIDDDDGHSHLVPSSLKKNDLAAVSRLNGEKNRWRVT